MADTWAERFAEDDKAAAEKERVFTHDEEQAAFMKKRSGENPLYRLAADLARGTTAGIRDTAYGAGDLLGDAWEGMGGSPESRDNAITRQKTERDPVFPHMSGSLAEKGGRVVGQAAPTMLVPGALPRTLGGAMKTGGLVGGAEGLIHSDSDELGGKLKDAAVGAGFGAAGSGAFHVPTRGTAVKSEAALAAEKAFNRELGDTRISPRISLGKSIGDSPDWGSKLTAKAAKRVQKGKRAADAKDLDQRVMDDFYQLELNDAFPNDHLARNMAKGELDDSRNWGNAYDLGKHIADGERLIDSSTTATTKQRALGRATAAAEQNRGRFSPAQAGQQGVSNMSRIPEALGAHAGQRVPKPGPPPTVGTGEVAPLAAGMVAGNPLMAGAGALPLAFKGRQIRKHNKQAKQYASQSKPFISRVDDLPEIKNSELGDFLTGNKEYQLKYKKLVKAGGGDILEDFINRLAATSLAGTDAEDPGRGDGPSLPERMFGDAP